MIEPYAPLPWWSCCHIAKAGKLPWSGKAVLAVVMGRLMSLKAAAQQDADYGADEELIGAIDNLGGDDRFQFSLGWLAQQTGLTRGSVVAGKRCLHARKVVGWTGGRGEDGAAAPDLLVPNWDFRVVVTPASNETCWVAFKGKRG